VKVGGMVMVMKGAGEAGVGVVIIIYACTCQTHDRPKIWTFQDDAQVIQTKTVKL
jgi:hypothetical protein